MFLSTGLAVRRLEVLSGSLVFGKLLHPCCRHSLHTNAVSDIRIITLTSDRRLESSAVNERVLESNTFG